MVLVFLLDLWTVQKNTDHHQSYSFRKVSSYTKQLVVREELRRSGHDTLSLSFWFEGQSEHPQRSSVNHITLNKKCWAPACRLWIHQWSETTLSVTGAVSIGQKRAAFFGTARHLMPFLLCNRCYVICLKRVVLLLGVVPFIQSGICASWHATFICRYEDKRRGACV